MGLIRENLNEESIVDVSTTSIFSSFVFAFGITDQVFTKDYRSCRKAYQSFTKVKEKTASIVCKLEMAVRRFV